VWTSDSGDSEGPQNLIESPLKAASPAAEGIAEKTLRRAKKELGIKSRNMDGPTARGCGTCCPRKAHAPKREVGHLPNVRVNTLLLLLDFFDHGQHGPSLNTPTLCPPSQMRAVFPPTARTSPLPWPTFSATGAACFP
jgi:hypothetical protein